MTMKLRKASDWCFEETIEVNTLEDLRKLSEKYDCSDLIVEFEANAIMIYDDYVE